MPKRNRSTSQLVIERRIKEGRGTGTGSDYKPWLNIQDVPSNGQANRKASWTVGREHQLMSQLELSYLFIFDWHPAVIDIREQYPLLPLEDTLAIAEEHRITHPKDTQTKEDTVVTTDFVLTLIDNNRLVQRAVAVKEVQELQDPRVIEKLEIERLYWQSSRVQWCIGTERNLNRVFVENVKLLHDYQQIPILEALEDIAIELTKSAFQPIALAALTAQCDRRLGLDRGTSLSIAYHLIATRRWCVDMRVPINPSKPLALLSASPCQDIDVARTTILEEAL